LTEGFGGATEKKVGSRSDTANGGRDHLVMNHSIVG